MPGKLYEPAQLDVLVGTTVTWKNDDAINHTVTADGDAFSSGYVPPGGSFTFTFAKQGRYPFHCTIHKFMRGEVDVFGLVLSGPEGPVVSGRRVVFAGLAPTGTETVTLRGAGGERTVRARPDGSFVVGVPVATPAVYRACRAPSSVRRSACSFVRSSTSRAPEGRFGPARPRRGPGRPPCCSRTTASASRGAPSPEASWTAVRACASRSRTALERVRVLVVGGKGWADAASRPLVLSGSTPE